MITHDSTLNPRALTLADITDQRAYEREREDRRDRVNSASPCSSNAPPRSRCGSGFPVSWGWSSNWKSESVLRAPVRSVYEPSQIGRAHV